MVFYKHQRIIIIIIIKPNMNINYPVFLFLLLMCRVAEMNFINAEYSFSDGDFKNVENFDIAESISTVKGDLELRKRGKNDFELKEFYSTGESLCQEHIHKYNNLLKTIDNYVQRYVSLFLISSNLLEYKIHDSNELINAELEVFISGEDLAFLQGYSKSRIKSSIVKDLPKLNDILEKSIKIKEESYLKETLKSAKSLFSFDFSFFSNKTIQMNYYLYPVSFLLIVAVNWYFFRYPFRKFPAVLLIVNSLILWEGFINYVKKLKNADLENSVRLRQYGGDCDVENQSWYRSITNLIFGNKCLQYHKAINHNPVEEVFLLDSIVNAYAFYLIRTPFKVIGSSLADLTGEITSTLPWPFNILFYAPILFFFVITFLLYLLISRGTHLRLSYFGSGLEIGKNPSVTAGPAASTSIKNQEPIQPARKLKGLISSKYPRRLDMIAAVVRRRKNSKIVGGEVEERAKDSEQRDRTDDINDTVRQS